MASDEHQELVRKLIEKFRAMGLTIECAAYTGYDECPKKGRYEPDVIGRDSSRLLYIGEAEICSTLDNSDTLEQFDDFSNRSMNSDGRKVQLRIVVPKSCESHLNKVLASNGLASRTNIRYFAF